MVYEKEVRRARKEAFKSSSALVTLQEELKNARNKCTLMREDVEVQKRKLIAKEQESFVIQRSLVELQEATEEQMQQHKVVEDERDALKTNLKELESMRAGSEPAVVPLPSNECEGLPSSKKRSRRSESMKENVDPQAPQLQDRLESMEEQLRMEKRMRLRADDQIHFMKMECQFQCCSCRMAERQQITYVHDDTLATEMAKIGSKVPEKSDESAPETPTEPSPAIVAQQVPGSIQDRQPCTPQRTSPSQRANAELDLLTFSPTTGTFSKVASPERPIILSPSQGASAPSPQAPQPTPSAVNLSGLHTCPGESTPSFTFPVTPRPLPITPQRTISYTRTTTVPLKDGVAFTPAPATPGGISREDALEQIRQRRGRARSIAAGNGTPRKKMVEIGELRRDISAPGRV